MARVILARSPNFLWANRTERTTTIDEPPEVPEVPEAPEVPDLITRIGDALADDDGISAPALAERIGESVSKTRRALIAAERLGYVSREGRARSTTWFLG